MAGKHGSRSKRLLCVHSQELERERLVVSSLTLSPDPFIHCSATHTQGGSTLQSLGYDLTHTHTEVCFLGASKPPSWHWTSTISKVIFVDEKAQGGFFLFCCFCFFLIWKSYPGRWKWFYGLLRKINWSKIGKVRLHSECLQWISPDATFGQKEHCCLLNSCSKYIREHYLIAYFHHQVKESIVCKLLPVCVD